MDAIQDRGREERIAAVRAFNRFYTKQIGLLEEGMVRSPFSLAEARVLFELAHCDAATATEVGASLGLDPGYLSRIVAKFVGERLIVKTPATADRRQHRLKLTPKGRRAFAQLDRGSNDTVRALLQNLAGADQERIVHAMETIERLLRKPSDATPAFRLRAHRPGDMGTVVARHGILYAQAHGWDMTFEALCAEIVAQFIRRYDERRERCFIAEIDGEPVGSVFLVRASDEVAKLRLILVEPKARRLGIGRALVEACIRFARESGYTSITLWTQSVLTEARRLYASTGFRCVHREAHTSFGHDLVGETWELTL